MTPALSSPPCPESSSDLRQEPGLPPVTPAFPQCESPSNSSSLHSSLLDIEFPPAILLPASIPKESVIPPLDLGFTRPAGMITQMKVAVAEPMNSWGEKEPWPEEPSLMISSSSEADTKQQDISRYSAFGVSSDFSKEGKSAGAEGSADMGGNRPAEYCSMPLLDLSQSALPSNFTIEDSLLPEQSPVISLRLTTKCSSEATTQTHRPVLGPVLKTTTLTVVAQGGETRLNEYRIEEEMKVEGLIGAWYVARGREKVTLWECNKKELGEDAIGAQVQVLQRVCHANVLRLLEVIDSPDLDFGYLVFEGVKGRLVEQGLQPDEVKEAFRALAHGVNYLHNVAQVVHLGIRPEALFIGTDGEIKLADFFAARDLQQSDETCNKREDYRGRRRRIKQHYKPTDILACGVTLYRLMFGALPFSCQDDENRGRRSWRAPEGMDQQLRDLFEGLFQRSPRKRLKISEVLRHPWLGQLLL